MPEPDFILTLRRTTAHDLLRLPGLTARIAAAVRGVSLLEGA